MDADKLYHMAAGIHREIKGRDLTPEERDKLKALCDDYASDPGGFERRSIQREIGQIKDEIRAIGGTIN